MSEAKTLEKFYKKMCEMASSATFTVQSPIYELQVTSLAAVGTERTKRVSLLDCKNFNFWMSN